jgi:DNA-binding CsgD family transcriptional regulator
MDARTTLSTPAVADLETYTRRIVAAVLERLCVPFLLLDCSGRVDFASGLAEEFLDNGQHLSVTDDGLLDLHSPTAAAELRGYLSTLGKGRTDINVLLVATDDSPPLFASLSAFTPPTMDGYPTLPPLAALFIREGGDEDGIAVARTRFNLSKAEASVLTAIVGGLSIGEHATRRGISVHTARKQLAIVMEKVGVSRQSQLAKMVDSLSGRGRDRAASEAMAARNESSRIAVSG